MAYTGICCWSVGLFQYCRPVPLLCSATLDQLLVLGATFYGSIATVACVQTSPISFAACGKGNAVCNKGNRRRLHTGNSNLNLKQFLSKI